MQSSPLHVLLGGTPSGDLSLCGPRVLTFWNVMLTAGPLLQSSVSHYIYKELEVLPFSSCGELGVCGKSSPSDYSN